MREIKFRAWDKPNRLMLDVGTLFFETGSVKGFFRKGEYWLHESNYILMQYTGLKSKSGVEIYEGDILESVESGEVFRVDEIFPVHRHTHVTNIGYFMGGKKKRTYHHRSVSAAYDNNDDWMSWPEMYEVIGNIYENPELLAK